MYANPSVLKYGLSLQNLFLLIMYIDSKFVLILLYLYQYNIYFILLYLNVSLI